MSSPLNQSTNHPVKQPTKRPKKTDEERFDELTSTYTNSRGAIYGVVGTFLSIALIGFLHWYFNR
ncbi:hypothetical protein GW916_10295 [bacterium]|nr:hypothetical protein [bacterium]